MDTAYANTNAQYLGQNAGGYNCSYTSHGTININASNTSSGGTTYAVGDYRSEEHTSDLQSPVPISYAVFCLKKKKL